MYLARAACIYLAVGRILGRDLEPFCLKRYGVCVLYVCLGNFAAYSYKMHDFGRISARYPLFRSQLDLQSVNDSADCVLRDIHNYTVSFNFSGQR